MPCDGSIPAGAGKPSGSGQSVLWLPPRVYPRGCGEAGNLPEPRLRGNVGLSPRVRGSHNDRVESSRGPSSSGLSPRVRGSRRAFASRVRNARGSIPAGAGKPTAEATWLYAVGTGLSPRVRGSRSCWCRCRMASAGGLSPRVRGSHVRLRRVLAIMGSIPAGAGKPGVPGWSRHRAQGVYPRGCGEADAAVVSDVRARGLSPRVRGSQNERCKNVSALGSIPAGAGKPGMAYRIASITTVYPRGCGEATIARIAALGIEGLSPRVRGSL